MASPPAGDSLVASKKSQGSPCRRPQVARMCHYTEVSGVERLSKSDGLCAATHSSIQNATDSRSAEASNTSCETQRRLFKAPCKLLGAPDWLRHPRTMRAGLVSTSLTHQNTAESLCGLCRLRMQRSFRPLWIHYWLLFGHSNSKRSRSLNSKAFKELTTSCVLTPYLVG